MLLQDRRDLPGKSWFRVARASRMSPDIITSRDIFGAMALSPVAHANNSRDGVAPTRG